MKKSKLVEIVSDKPVVAVLANARRQMLMPVSVEVKARHGTNNPPGRNQISSIFGILMHGNNNNETFRELADKDPRYHGFLVDYVLDTIIEYGVEL